jgi:hypothetical protein
VKWLLFFLSLVALFFANSVLFWMAGKYDWFTSVAAPVSICAAIVLAWASSKRFARKSSATFSPGFREILAAPPAVICIFVLILFGVTGLLKFIAYR